MSRYHLLWIQQKLLSRLEDETRLTHTNHVVWTSWELKLFPKPEERKYGRLAKPAQTTTPDPNQLPRSSQLVTLLLTT